MKTGKTLTEMAIELERQSASKADYRADTRQIGFHPETSGDVYVTIDGVESPTHYTDGVEHLGSARAGFKLGEIAHDQIAGRLKIPAKFYDRLRADHPDILGTTVTALFNREPERRLVRTLDGNARAFLSDRYRMVDSHDLLNAVLPVFAEFGDVEIASCELTESRMYVKAMLPRVQAEIKVGDVVRAGVMISNSEVGLGAIVVAPMVERLVCSNGMISDVAMRKYHTGRRGIESDEAYQVFSDETMRLDDAALFAKVTDLVRAAGSEAQFQSLVSQMQDLAGLTLPGVNPVQAVEKLAKRIGATEDESGSILRHLIEGGDLSAWGVLNAVTRTSQDLDSYDRATEFEQIGGTLLAMPATEWAALAA